MKVNSYIIKHPGEIGQEEIHHLEEMGKYVENRCG